MACFTVLVALAIDPFSLRQMLLLLLSLAHLEHLFNKQGLKPRQTRLSTRAEATGACGGFFSVIPILLCPKSSWTTFAGTPILNNNVAALCRKSWKRT